MKRALQIISTILLSHVALTTSAVEIRDYYSEPGINPFKQGLNQSAHEHIDPFSGTLQLTYTDMVVPGNGGMDIVVNRVYTSLQTNQYPHKSLTGIGWTMHFGRVVASQANQDKICPEDQALFSVSTKDNPSLEFADGARELMVLNNINNDNSLITRSNWKAICNPSGPGLIVTSPSGVTYTMDQFDNFQEEPSWLTSRIEDLHGNWIQIDYAVNALGIRYMTEVFRSDVGSTTPVVTFEYEPAMIDTADILLRAVVANGQRWEYDYTLVEGFLYNRYQLTQVTRPDGRTWQYAYNGKADDPDPSDGVNEDGLASYSLNSVTYPDGGQISYTYQFVYFEQGSSKRTTSIASKTTILNGNQEATWTYEFAPHSIPYSEGGITVNMDETTITAPDAVYVYNHYGKGVGGGLDENGVWTNWFFRPSIVGLLVAERTLDSSGLLLEETTNDWDWRIISNENYFHGGHNQTWWVDEYTATPILLGQRYTRDGGFTRGIDYSEHDEYGNPGATLEYVNLAADDHRLTRTSYYNDAVNWIIGIPQTEEILSVDPADGSETSVGTVSRVIDSQTGKITSETKFGVTTQFTYTLEGDLETLTDPRGKITTFSNYKRGVAQREDRPENVTVFRTVNDEGTVASQNQWAGVYHIFHLQRHEPVGRHSVPDRRSSKRRVFG
ncbi:hypothetical protein ACXYTJ_02225 [Gilvimarinus sp. F26214L]|uniref:hypothetical protein n=1 Tax=Gilvimarinus sp. DZF01 TaxID=3461371 RepID=UPI0040452C7F